MTTSGECDHGKAGVILVLDDEADIGEVLQLLLEGEDYEVHAFQSSQAAFDDAVKGRIDAAIVDVTMPPPDGIDFARRLRADVRTCDIKIALHTALLESVVRDRFVGYDAFFRKPASVAVIVDGLRTLIG